MDAEQCSIDLDHDGDGINDQLVAFNAAWEFVATQLSAPAIKRHATARRSASLTKFERVTVIGPPYAFKQSVH